MADSPVVNAKSKARMFIPGLLMVGVGVILPVLGFFLNFQLFPPTNYHDNTVGWVAAGAVVFVFGLLWCGNVCWRLIFGNNGPTPDAARCKNCGHTNQPAAKFCSNCGNRMG
jgi:hypothetical protein